MLNFQIYACSHFRRVSLETLLYSFLLMIIFISHSDWAVLFLGDKIGHLGTVIKDRKLWLTPQLIPNFPLRGHLSSSSSWLRLLALLQSKGRTRTIEMILKSTVLDDWRSMFGTFVWKLHFTCGHYTIAIGKFPLERRVI